MRRLDDIIFFHRLVEEDLSAHGNPYKSYRVNSITQCVGQNTTALSRKMNQAMEGTRKYLDDVVNTVRDWALKEEETCSAMVPDLSEKCTAAGGEIS